MLKDSAAIEDEFLHPTLGSYTLDYYADRRAIVEALRRALPHFHGTVLDIGCGRQPYRPLLLTPPSVAKSYLGLDLANGPYGNQPDLVWDGETIPLEGAAIDSILLTEVLEHCPDPRRVLQEAARVLRPGGFLFCSVPFLWPLHDAPHDYYRFTPFALTRLLEQAGFERSEIDAHGGWDSSLSQMLGLWVSRRPMPELRRRILRKLAVPICRWLLGQDKPPRDFRSESVMLTGVTARAWKSGS